MNISFDFDFTLWNPETVEPIHETLAILKLHQEAGANIIIVSARFVEDEMEEMQQILTYLGIGKLLVFSAPGRFVYNECQLCNKSDILIRNKIQAHYDDWPEDFDLAEAIAAGIKVIEVKER